MFGYFIVIIANVSHKHTHTHMHFFLAVCSHVGQPSLYSECVHGFSMCWYIWINVRDRVITILCENTVTEGYYLTEDNF